MPIHVIKAGLGIVFDRKDTGLRPITALRDALDNPAHSEVVVCNLRARRRAARSRARGVITWEKNDDQIRPVTLLFVIGEFLQEHVRANGVGDAHIPAGCIGATIAAQGVNLDRVFKRNLPCLAFVLLEDVEEPGISRARLGPGHFSVIPKRKPVQQHMVPDESGGRIAERIVAGIGITAREAAE